jgi:NADH-quinone oxidoreductase subunit N
MPSFDTASLPYGLLAPQWILTGLIFACLAVDLIAGPRGHRTVGWVAVIGTAIAAGAQASVWGARGTFAGVLRIDEYSSIFNLIFMIGGIGVLLISFDYVERFLGKSAEFYAFVIAGILGMGLMSQAQELITAYIALELLSFSSYILVSYARTNLKSNEAGLKYVVVGSFSSAILLYGISLLYGAIGSTMFADIQAALVGTAGASTTVTVGLVMLTAGLAFKLAAVPFHLYSPDVYEGAPTPVTAYLSVASKAAAFALTMRLVVGGLWPLRGHLADAFAVLAILTMTLGNVVALRQSNIKRLMAYSSIAQAGYTLAAIAAFFAAGDIPAEASRGVILQLVGYMFTTLAAFGGVIAFQVATGGRERITDLAGLSRRSPFAAFALTSALFSLAGMPIFSGFVTKLFLFTPVAKANMLWMVAIAIANSTISLFYYLQVISQMYGKVPAGLVAINVADVEAAAQATHVLEAGHGDDHTGVHRALDGGHDGGTHSEPVAPWAVRGLNEGMPIELRYPVDRLSIEMRMGILVALAGTFLIGLYPSPIVELAQGASLALFAR